MATVQKYSYQGEFLKKITAIPFDDYLKMEQAKGLFDSMLFIVVSSFAVSILTVGILWNAYSHSNLLIWLVVSLIILFARWWTSRSYRPENISPSNHQYWLNLFTFFAFLTGTNFGLISIFFFSAEQHTYMLFVTCLFAGYLAATSSVSGIYLPAFNAFGLPTSILFFIGYIRQSDSINISVYFSVGFMILFYYLVMLRSAKNTRNLYKEGRNLYYQNNQLLEEIVLQKDNAEQAVDAKNQFLAAASHDLRQPLHAMGLFIDALRPHVKNHSGKEIVEKISQSKHAINGLLHGLLDISRLDADVVENYPKHIALLPILESIDEEYKLTAQAKNIQFDVQVKQQVVYIDPVLIERVLRNLIDNAIKYTHQGSVNVKVFDSHEVVQVVIEDTGIGIPADKRQEVFIEFTQLNNPERDRRKGLGLGLSIVKRLCKLMNIKFELQTKEYKGTKVILNLPKGEATQVLQRLDSIEPLMKGLNIIVIDDEKDILDAMLAILCNWGCKVTVALTGDEAIKVLHKSDTIPDIIIADFRLRDNENGIKLIERIREEYNENISALLITGDTAPDRLQLAQAADVLVLHKPVEAKELSIKIQSLLQR